GELLGRRGEAARQRRGRGLAGDAVALRDVGGVGDGAEAAGDAAGVGFEVVHLVEDAGVVEDAALLRAGAVRERAGHRDGLARTGGEGPGDVVGEPVGVAAAAARPAFAALGAVGAGVGPAAAAGEEEALAALHRQIVGGLRGGRGLDGGGERLAG